MPETFLISFLMPINSLGQVFFALPVYIYFPVGKVKLPGFPIRMEQVLPTLIRSWYTPELLLAMKVMPVYTATSTHLNSE